MKADYVIISSDDNPLYKDFYPIVAQRWKDLGYKTYYLNITDNTSIDCNEYGVVHKIKKVEFIPTSFQSQVIRLFSSNFINGNLLMSDIDMLPISKDYFNKYDNELENNNIILYSGQPYGVNPYYPMCYVLGHSTTLKKYLNIDKISFEEYCKVLSEKIGIKWNTDEHFMYESLQPYKQFLRIKQRDFTRRINRPDWIYDTEKLSQGFYIDSHMLRPYSMYKDKIDKLISDIKIHYG